MDKYEENLQAAEAQGREIWVEMAESRAKKWYERKQRAEQNGEPFNEPSPWEK